MNCVHCAQEGVDFCDRCDGHVLPTAEVVEGDHSPRTPESRAPATPERDAERRQITVLFCDLVGATALSELLDPEDLRALLREYQQRCGAVIRRFRGHVAQYLGDGLLAYFGYPHADEHAARCSVDAALNLVSAMNMRRSKDSLQAELNIRVGIHTGFVVMGSMGDSEQPERLAVGSTPNLAARIQAEADSNAVLISDATYALVGGYFECDSLGVRRLRGVSRKTTLYRVVGRSPASTRMDIAELRGFSPFGGRQAELDFLLSRWAQRDASGPAVLVVGDPGVGKSRLLHEAVTRIGDATIMSLPTSEAQQSDAFFPIAHGLSRWAGLSHADAANINRDKLGGRLAAIGQEAAIADLFYLLSLRGDDPVTLQAPPSQKQHAILIRRLLDVFAAIERKGPLVLVVDDLHWADASTMEFLQQWLTQQRRTSALTLATVWRSAVPAWAASAPFDLLELGPLSRPAALSLATHVARRMRAADIPDLLEKVVDRAEGMPLFIEEITRTLVVLSEMSPSSAVPLSAEKLEVPASLEDSLMARLDRLGRAKDVVQLAAVIGRQVPFDWLDQISSVGTEGLARELERIESAGLLYESAPSPRTYAFTHALIQDVAYRSLAMSSRQQIHRRVAEMLASDSAMSERQPLLLAHHYEAAGMALDAVRHLRIAGQRALSSSAFVEAIEVYQRALALISGMPQSRQRDGIEIELSAGLGLALISTRGYSSNEVEGLYSRARRLCEAYGDVPLRVLYGIWGVHLVRGDGQGVNRLAVLFNGLLQSTSTPDAQLIARSCLGVRAFYRINLAEARAHLEAATRLIEPSDVRAQHRRLLAGHGFEGVLSGPVWLAWIEALEGNYAEARDRLREAEALAEKAGDPYTICQVSAYFGALSRELHDVDAALRFAGRVSTLSAEHGMHFWQAIGLCVLGWVHLRRHEVEAALSLIRNGLAMLDAIGSVVNRSYFASYLVEAYLDTEQPEAGLVAVDEALGLCRDSLGATYEAELLRLRGRLLLQMGSQREAKDYFRAAMATAAIARLRAFELRAALDLSQLLRKEDRFSESRDVLETCCLKWPNRARGIEIDTARLALLGESNESVTGLTPDADN